MNFTLLGASKYLNIYYTVCGTVKTKTKKNGFNA